MECSGMECSICRRAILPDHWFFFKDDCTAHAGCLMSHQACHMLGNWHLGDHPLVEEWKRRIHAHVLSQPPLTVAIESRGLVAYLTDTLPFEIRPFGSFFETGLLPSALSKDVDDVTWDDVEELMHLPQSALDEVGNCGPFCSVCNTQMDRWTLQRAAAKKQAAH